MVYLNDTEMEKYKNGAFGIYSITVYGEKPGAERAKQLAEEKKTACCGPDSTCC